MEELQEDIQRVSKVQTRGKEIILRIFGIHCAISWQEAKILSKELLKAAVNQEILKEDS